MKASHATANLEERAFRVSEDRKSVRISFSPDSFLLADSELVESLISELMHARGEMLPATPVVPGGDDLIRVLNDPPAHVEPDQSRGGATLSIFHRGAGWLCFWFSPGRYGRLVQEMKAAGDRGDESPPSITRDAHRAHH